ncbi:MAG: hypothetical protein KDJ48_05605 [Nitratireductor sp.]|nr:hypothetical protein [Nitratireductor sp.]MCB1458726.1 hypothetical protein [Nitratireductor sp.]
MELEIIGLLVGLVTAAFSATVGKQVLESVENQQRKKRDRENEQIEAAIRAVNGNRKAVAIEAIRKLDRLRAS